MRLLRKAWRRGGEAGQTLPLVVMLMLVLLVMCFFAFDLHQAIKLRMKTQTGVDAAALTGAAWQGRTLNTIGELNLLKGATVILTGVPPYPDDGDDTTDELLDSVDMLSAMQVRLSYVGPLLGLAAAQQSAKNNGVRNNEEYTGYVNNHVNTWLDAAGGSPYEGMYTPTPLAGMGVDFRWVPAYQQMLEDVVSRGVAAYPFNQRYLFGAGRLNGLGGSLLGNPAFYRAVLQGDFCWFRGMGLNSDSPPIDLLGLEYRQEPEGYFMGSEYLPLNIELATYSDRIRLQGMIQDRGWTPLPDDQPGVADIIWTTYDQTWHDPFLYDQAEQYMRSDFRDQYAYGGADVVMRSTGSPTLISGAWRWEYGDDPAEMQSSIGLGLLEDGGTSAEGNAFRENAARVAAAEANLNAVRQNQIVFSRSAAKPFGSLGDQRVSSAGIVLPVFTDVRLIPLIVVEAPPLIDNDRRFYQFLLEYFGHPNYPDVPDDIVRRYSDYLTAIEMYNDINGPWRDRWRSAEAYWDDYADGDDDIPGTDDDRTVHRCDETYRRPGGGGGGGSRGGPEWLH